MFSPLGRDTQRTERDTQRDEHGLHIGRGKDAGAIAGRVLCTRLAADHAVVRGGEVRRDLAGPDEGVPAGHRAPPCTRVSP